MYNPEAILSSLEDRRAFRAKPLRVTDIPCSECGQALIEDEFALGFVRVCDNHDCSLFRRPQGTRMKEIIPIPQTISRTWRPMYNEELRKAKQNYTFLCKAGIRAKLAATHKSNKQTQRIRQMLKRGLSPEFINRELVRC